MTPNTEKTLRTRAGLLTCSGVTGVGQSEQSFLLENDAPTNQEGGQQGQSQAQPQVVGCVYIWRQTVSQLSVCLSGCVPVVCVFNSFIRPERIYRIRFFDNDSPANQRGYYQHEILILFMDLQDHWHVFYITMKSEVYQQSS